MTRKPDDRPAATVWKFFAAAFEGRDFPNVSWALGSDWMAGATLSPEAYRARATALMVEIYGDEE